MRPSSFARPLAIGALCLSGLACRWPVRYDVKPGTAPRCADGVCFEIVHFRSHEDAIGAWIDAPPGTRLLDARFAVDDEPACTRGVPVTWVRVGVGVYRWGPADVSGSHGVVLAFPLHTWWAHQGSWRDTFVDVDLDVAGLRRCVRARLTRTDGEVAVRQ
jgi:hypothetical protein